MAMLDTKVSYVVDSPNESWWDEEWMEDLAPYPCRRAHSIIDEERTELKNALNLLDHHTAA